MQQRELWESLYGDRLEDVKAVANKPNKFAVHCAAYLPKGGLVADIGCGTGRDTRFFASARNCRVIALDFSGEALSQLRASTPNDLIGKIITVQGDMTALPISRHGQLDGIYARSSLHLDDTQVAHFFADCFQMLKIGGLVMVEGRTISDSKIKRSTVISPHLYRDHDGHVRRGWSKETIIELTGRLGLELLDVRETIAPFEGRVLGYISFIAKKG